MKVALDTGDVLDVAILDGDRVVGTVSLQIKSLVGVTPKAAPKSASAAASTAGSASAPAATGTRKRKARKPLSEEARARMAAAQKARWERIRAEEGGDNTAGGNQGQ